MIRPTLSAWLVATVVALAIPQVTATGDIGRIEIKQATLDIVDTDGNVVHTEPVALPEVWDADRRRLGARGIYRFEVRLDSSADQPAGFYVSSIGGSLEVFWDGQLIGKTIPFTGTGIPSVSGPFIAPIPADSLHAGRHRVELHFEGNPSLTNFIRRPQIGPMSILEPDYVRKRLTLMYLPITLSLASIVIALVFYAAYRTDVTTRGVGWLAAGIVAASLSVLGLYLSTPDAVTPLVGRIRPAAFHASFLCFLFALNQMEDRYFLIGRILALAYLGFAIALFTVPTTDAYTIAARWTLVTWGVGVFLLIRAWRLALAPPRHLAAIAPAAMIIAVIVHDLSGALNNGEFLAGQLLSMYNPPLLAFTLIFLWVAKARRHTSELDVLNRELEARIAAKHAELEANYEHIAAADRRAAVQAERERMVREMHDGLGGQLTSTLALVESGQYEGDEIEAALRDSLDDLRLMVGSLDQPDASVTDLLALLRERIEPRLTRRGLRFRWRLQDLDPDGKLLGERAHHVMRIVQEAISNIVKHADARTITLATGQDSQGNYLYIEDDGKGLQAGSLNHCSGRGLQYMRERAAQIGSELTVERGTDGKGTRVLLRFNEVQAP